MSEAQQRSGTMVKLPPQPQPTTAESSAAVSTLDAKIAQRQAAMEKRKRELLVEARSARLDWIMGGSNEADSSSSTNGVGASTSSGGSINLLKNLQACTNDILPSAPQVIESMLFHSNCDYHQQQQQQQQQDAGSIHGGGDTTTSAGFVSSTNKKIEQTLNLQNLSLASVISPDDPTIPGNKGKEEVSKNDETNSLLNLPPIPSPSYYKAFLTALCDPSSADLVLSIQKFCKTIEEAGRVMVEAMQEEGGNVLNGGEGGSSNVTSAGLKGSSKVGKADGNVSTSSTAPPPATTTTTEQQQQEQQNNNYASLAKAVRGFISKTLREMEDHDSFAIMFCSAVAGVSTDTKQTDEKRKRMEPMFKDQLQFSLEAFVYSKVRTDIYKVLLASSAKVATDPSSPSSPANSTTANQRRNMQQVENELHTKMSSLQFVTPAHLEITCLKEAGAMDIDLSYTIQQLKSIQNIEVVSSPRQLLRTLILAHRGISVALNAATSTGTNSNNPPGADDVLPTLILAILRATPKTLSTTLLFIEHFAPLSLMRGESGYAYTNICGALHFIQELDVEGHLSEVALVGDEVDSGKMGGVLSIGPEEFRRGLEDCRRKIEDAEKKKVEEEEKEMLVGEEKEGEDINNEVDVSYDDALDEESGKVALMKAKISARQVREARSLGQTVDLDWAIQEQHKHESMLKYTATKQASQQPPHPSQSNIPPETPPLPSNFTRSYSYLTAHPEQINLRDLPNLLAEYKLLVHATEKLLNERSVWREQERKKQLKAERTRLEHNFATYVTGGSGGENGDIAAVVELANGH